MRKLKLVSLFSGCGGSDLGFMGGFNFLDQNYKRLSTKLLYANDFDEKICDIYDRNFSIPVSRGDLRNIQIKGIPDHDILTAGFPCQSYSIAAQNPPRLGIKDSDKGTLFEEVCRVLRKKQPLCFVCENVKGILSSNHGLAFPLIISSLRKCGYSVIHLLLNAYQYGIPQRRERVFIIGFREPEYMDLFCPPLPIEERHILGEVLEEIDEIPDKYYFSNRAVEGLKRSNKIMNKGRVQSPDSPCNTVGAHLAKVSLNSTDPVFKVNGKYRRFTPREVARIQSFPEDFELVGTDGNVYKALGNAIPPVLAWHVASSVVETIRKVENLKR